MAILDNQEKKTKIIVCVVDSDSTLRQRLVSVLQSSTQEVKTFENAGKFLIQLGEILPNCLIISAKLPGMGAIDLMYQLNNQGLDIPTIVLGEGDISEAVLAMRAGAQDFITKPFTDRKLCVSVKRVIESNSQVI